MYAELDFGDAKIVPSFLTERVEFRGSFSRIGNDMDGTLEATWRSPDRFEHIPAMKAIRIFLMKDDLEPWHVSPCDSNNSRTMNSGDTLNIQQRITMMGS